VVPGLTQFTATIYTSSPNLNQNQYQIMKSIPSQNQSHNLNKKIELTPMASLVLTIMFALNNKLDGDLPMTVVSILSNTVKNTQKRWPVARYLVGPVHLLSLITIMWVAIRMILLETWSTGQGTMDTLQRLVEKLALDSHSLLYNMVAGAAVTTTTALHSKYTQDFPTSPVPTPTPQQISTWEVPGQTQYSPTTNTKAHHLHHQLGQDSIPPMTKYTTDYQMLNNNN
jgi:hypothetical protein